MDPGTPARWVAPLVVAFAAPLAAQTTVVPTSPEQEDPARVGVHEVFELTLEKDADYGRHANSEDVELTLDLVAPSGHGVTVRGFYYHTRADGRSLWKARFAPDELGAWSYAWTWIHVPSSALELGSGAFTCVPGSDPGFLRLDPADPHGWRHADGSRFAGLGINADYLVIDTGARDSAFGTAAVGGETLATRLGVFRDAGFDLARLRHASEDFLKFCRDDAGIAGDGVCETYLPEMAIVFDGAVQTLRRQGYRILFCMLGNAYPEGQLGSTPSAEQRRLMDYCIARWGAYVDLWELANEREPGVSWEQQAAAYVHQNDPYGHPVTTSYFPDPAYAAWPGELDFLSPHWYETESELVSDQVTAARALDWKTQYGSPRPVVVGEQGNQVCGGGGGTTPPEHCRSWQNGSRRRQRLRLWTAFFENVTVVVWQNGWGTDGNGGLYLGFRSRNELQALRRFMDVVARPGTVPAAVSVSSPATLRAYGLASTASGIAAAYVHRHDTHVGTASGESIQLDVPAAGTGYWIDPTSGRVLASAAVAAGPQVVPMPPIRVDLAYLAVADPLDVPPVARVLVVNPQWDGDADDDGTPDYGPANPPQGRAPLTLDLDASTSSDWDGGALTFRWDLGDGTSASGAAVTHTWAERRSYRVVLEATDDEGRKARQSFVVRALADPTPGANDPPVFQALEPVTVREGEAVHLYPRILDRELAGGTWTNEFPPLSSYSASGLPPGASYQPLPHAIPNGPLVPRELLWVPTLDQAGTYVVRFDVQDAGGLAAAPLFATIVVRDTPGPVAPDGARGATSNYRQGP